MSSESASTMSSRERIKAILSGRQPDRVGYQDTDFFSDTIDRWHAEGLPGTVDVLRRDWPWLNVPGLRYFADDIYVTWPDISPKYDIIEYEVQDDWLTFKDEYGATKKSWRGKTASPQYLDYAIKEPRDFKEKIEPLLDHEDGRRVSGSRYPFRRELEQMVKHRQQEFFVVVGTLGPWEYSTYLCGGLAATLIFTMKNQEFAAYMFNRIGEFLAKVCEAYIDAGVDGLWMFEDQGSQDGPFFSPKLYSKLLKSAHERICEPFRQKGLPRLLHSDGHLEPLIPQMIEAGFDALHPVQNKAGMNVERLKQTYGERLTLIGGMDTRILSSGDLHAIENEVRSKIATAGRGGRYIAASDGPVPPTISFDNYKFFVGAVKKYGCYPLES